jgi:hypothetical protein
MWRSRGGSRGGSEGRGVARDEREALGTRVQAVAAQHLPDPVRGDDDPAPLLARELARDAPRSEPGVRDREAEDPLLDHPRQRVGHLRAPPFPRAQHLQPVAIDLALPRVIRRPLHPERPARVRHARSGGEREQLQAIAEQHVILRHAALLRSLGGEGAASPRCWTA